jgi:16S rRNA (guanine966-N2)-methyltransferase
VRIIAGRLKGRRFTPPTWDGLRPTSDKLRETLFNVLAPRVDGARVLDAFAGTGALGFEALSRGAAHVVFVESDRRAAALITRAAAAWGVEGGYTIHVGDAVDWLRRLGDGPRFDLILLDPPYSSPQIGQALAAGAACLAQDGLLVLERAARREPDVPPALARVRDLKSGDSTLTFFARTASPDNPEKNDEPR